MYNETHDLYLKLSDYFIQDKSKILDIGCSTGNFITNVYKRHSKNNKKLSFIGVDNVDKMISFCKKKNKKFKISFLLKDIFSYKIENCCIVSSLYTMQFISTPKRRQIMVNKIFKGLNWGGAFFMVEKVRGPDARFQDILSQIFLEFKVSKGFSPSQILSKSRSLKGVLEPFSTKGNLDILKRAGFKDTVTVFKYGCFEGYLAIK